MVHYMFLSPCVHALKPAMQQTRIWMRRGAPLKDLATSVALEVLLQIPRVMVQLPSVLVGLVRYYWCTGSSDLGSTAAHFSTCLL